MKTMGSLLAENEYLILLNVPPQIKERIIALKMAVAEKHNVAVEAGCNDILLARFTSLAAREAILIQAIMRVAKEVNPFILSFKGIESVPSHSYKIPATSKVELTGLVKHLKKISTAIRAKEIKPFFTDEFGMPLFTKLTPAEFDAMQPELKQTDLFFQGMGGELKLLKKNKSTGTGWQPAQVFHLKKEDTIKQTLLF